MAGLLALGATLAFSGPAAAAPTPPGTLSVSNLGGAQLCNGAAQHQFAFQIDLNRGAVDPDVVVDITEFHVTFTQGGTPQDFLSAFANNDPIPAASSVAVASVIGPGSAGSLSATATIVAVDPDEQVETPVQLTFGPVAYAACGPVGTTSSTTSTTAGSTTSTTSGSTTSTTAGATTTTVAGSTTTTSTTLGPNDTTGTLTVSPTSIAQGSSFTVAGTGFSPNVDVTVTLFSDPIALGTLRSNASGAISGSLSMPTSAPVGAHKMEAKGPNPATGSNILSANVQVTARGTGTSNIPRTGDTTDLLLPIGIAVVSFGILAFAWRERRLQQG